LRHQPVLNGDETGYRTNGEKRWLWAVVAPMFVVYRIAPTRAADVLVALLGDVFAGVLCSDRWRPYQTYHRGELQFCWAHFKRNILGALELVKTTDAERFCRDALALHARLFRLWYRFRGDPAARGGSLTRPQLIDKVLPLQRQFFALAERHLNSPNKDVRNLAAALFAHHEKFFVFVHHDGVEPTNNRAERALRAAVVWGSLYVPLSQARNHWCLIVAANFPRATRRVTVRDRGTHGGAIEVCAANLPWRIRDNARVRRCVSHRHPLLGVDRRCIGANAGRPPIRLDTPSGPRLSLSRADAHPIEHGGRVLIRPGAGTLQDHRRGLVGRTLAMLSRSRLPRAHFGVLAATPMDHEDDLARDVVDVHHDLLDERPHELLLDAGVGRRGLPGRAQIARQPQHGLAVRRGRRRCGRFGQACLAHAQVSEGGIPPDLKFGGNQTVVRIHGFVPPLREMHGIPRLFALEFEGAAALGDVLLREIHGG
jgi:hypothetical protein